MVVWVESRGSRCPVFSFSIDGCRHTYVRIVGVLTATPPWTSKKDVVLLRQKTSKGCKALFYSNRLPYYKGQNNTVT